MFFLWCLLCIGIYVIDVVLGWFYLLWGGLMYECGLIDFCCMFILDVGLYGFVGFYCCFDGLFI